MKSMATTILRTSTLLLACWLLLITTALAEVSTAPLTLEDAVGLALQNANLTADQAIVTKASLDQEHGKPMFEVELITKDTEYEYDFDFQTGAVLKASTEGLDREKAVLWNATYLTLEEAKARALEHAKVEAANASYTSLQLDVDDGIITYEIEFTAAGTAYEVELDAKDGRQLKMETMAVQP